MSKAKKGDTVKVHYTGWLENGTAFDNSKQGQPLEVTIGSGRVIPGFEKALIGMEPGETKTITIPPEEAYGPRPKQLIADIKRSNLPEHISPAMGKQLRIRHSDGHHTDVIITDMTADRVTLDANHPSAGVTLTSDIHLVAIA